MKNKTIAITGLSAAAGYGLLKTPYSKVDPYTRATIGIISGFGLAIYGGVKRNPLLLFSGIGLGIAGFLTLEEVTRIQGAKIISNEYNKPVYIYKEDLGVVELKPFEIPNYRIEGLTIAGYNSVFKSRDGIYLKILADGTITETFGMGYLINKLGGGKKDILFCEQESINGNPKWLELYNKSV